MKINIDLNSKDFAHLERWQHRASRVEIAVLWLILFIWIGTQQFRGEESARPMWALGWKLYAYPDFLIGHALVYLFLIIPSGAFLCLWLFLLRPMLWNMWRLVRKAKVLNVQRAITHQSGLRLVCFENEAFYFWPQVKNWESTKTHIVAQLVDGAVFTIPKRAFVNEAAARQFYELTRQFWQQSRKASPPIPVP